MQVNKPQPPSTGPLPVNSMSVDANNRVTENQAKPEKTQQPVAPPPQDNKQSVGSYPKGEGPVSSITLCAVKPPKGGTTEVPNAPEKPRMDGGSNITLCAVRPPRHHHWAAPKAPKREHHRGS